MPGRLADKNEPGHRRNLRNVLRPQNAEAGETLDAAPDAVTSGYETHWHSHRWRCPPALNATIAFYDLQKSVVIVCGEGIVDEQGRQLGAEVRSTDPWGNVVLSGAADALRSKQDQMIGDSYFQLYRRRESAKEAIFTRLETEAV